MNETRLYHFELGIPKAAQLRFGKMPLNYSGHAQRASQNDRYGTIELPKYLDTNTAQVIEVEMRGRETLKIVYRVKYNEILDLVLVVIPDRGFVKTVWLNQRNDLHKTLDASRYTSLK